MRPEREALKGTIEDSVIFGSSLKRMRPYMEKVLLSASSSTPTPPEEARKKLKAIQGSLDSIQESLDWVNDNRQTLTEVATFGDGGRQPGLFFGPHSIETDSRGNIYTTETYEGKRVQRFLFKGMAPVTRHDQGAVWPAGATKQ